MKPALLTLFLILAGCAAPPNAKKVRIANISAGLQTYCMPITLADTLGFYKEEGLDVVLENLPNTVKALQALLGGSADVAGITYQQTVQMVAQGQPIRSFFIMNWKDSKVLIVAPAAQERLRRVEDLKGALVGVSAPGTATHLWMSRYLATKGLPPSAYSLVSIGIGAQAIAALESGRIHAAALAGGDHYHLLLRHPDLRILVDAGTPGGMRESSGTSAYAGGTLSASQDWLTANPDTARRLSRALLRAHHWIAAHSPEEILAKLPPGLHSANTAVDLQILRWSLDAYTPGGALPAGAHEAMQKLLDATLENVHASRVEQASAWTGEYLPNTK